MTKLSRIFSSIRSVRRITGRVTAFCAACGATRLVSAQAWSFESKPVCVCGKPMYHAHPEQLVTVIATFHYGKQVDENGTKERHRKTKPVPIMRCYQPRESAAIKPDIVLKQRGDYIPTQQWRRNGSGE